jgi:hypothetical protein
MGTKYALRVCYGKKSYGSYREADHARKELRRIGDVRTPMSVYRCEVCGQFHFGHLPETLTGQRRTLRHQREANEHDIDSAAGTGTSDLDFDYRPSGKRWRGAA